jgi:hypothetical protein
MFYPWMGAISGLVMITPSAGFIDLPMAFCFGILGALVCRQALRIKFSDFARRWRWVDHGDTFATHCLGGVLATIATGCFARKEVAGNDGVTLLRRQRAPARYSDCGGSRGVLVVLRLELHDLRSDRLHTRLRSLGRGQVSRVDEAMRTMLTVTGTS